MCKIECNYTLPMLLSSSDKQIHSVLLPFFVCSFFSVYDLSNIYVLPLVVAQTSPSSELSAQSIWPSQRKSELMHCLLSHCHCSEPHPSAGCFVVAIPSSARNRVIYWHRHKNNNNINFCASKHTQEKPSHFLHLGWFSPLFVCLYSNT